MNLISLFRNHKQGTWCKDCEDLGELIIDLILTNKVINDNNYESSADASFGSISTSSETIESATPVSIDNDTSTSTYTDDLTIITYNNLSVQLPSNVSSDIQPADIVSSSSSDTSILFHLPDTLSSNSVSDYRKFDIETVCSDSVNSTFDSELETFSDIYYGNDLFEHNNIRDINNPITIVDPMIFINDAIGHIPLPDFTLSHNSSTNFCQDSSSNHQNVFNGERYLNYL